MVPLIILFNSTGRFVPDYIFHSWLFWILLVVMIGAVLLYHNLVTLRRKSHRSGVHLNERIPDGTSASARRISYTSEGRSGYVIYRSETSSFSMYYEFGGGNCIAWIDVPRPEVWEKVTGMPLTRRDEVLNEIGTQVVKDQVWSGIGYYRIEGDAINIYT